MYSYKQTEAHANLTPLARFGNLNRVNKDMSAIKKFQNYIGSPTDSSSCARFGLTHVIHYYGNVKFSPREGLIACISQIFLTNICNLITYVFLSLGNLSIINK